MTVPNTPSAKQDLLAHAATRARDRELFYYELICILLSYVSPEDLQNACEAALEQSSTSRSYHEA
jgi:hypothetical protein